MDRQIKLRKIQEKALNELDKSRTQLYKETKGTDLGTRKQDFLKITKQAREKGKPTIKPKKKPKKKKKKKKKRELSEGQKKGLSKGYVRRHFEDKDLKEIYRDLEDSKLDFGKNYRDFLQIEYGKAKTGKSGGEVNLGKGYEIWKFDPTESTKQELREKLEEKGVGRQKIAEILSKRDTLKRFSETEAYIKYNPEDPFTLDLEQQITKMSKEYDLSLDIGDFSFVG
ncbi:MAG: hypothetical protein ACOC1X_01415, partial [Promethearchaeota archaeon]